MSFESMVFIVGVIIQISAFDAWYQVAIGRLISGLGVGALSAAVPMVCSSSLLGIQSLTYHFSVSIRDSPKANPWYLGGLLPALHHFRYLGRILYLDRHPVHQRKWLMAIRDRYRHLICAILGCLDQLYARVVSIIHSRFRGPGLFMSARCV